jgi:hypothetical protein
LFLYVRRSFIETTSPRKIIVLRRRRALWRFYYS